jgi:2,4-dienoyl-CoA reductase-like NADH-dependent reductase (Old Yellow Enzyme family)
MTATHAGVEILFRPCKVAGLALNNRLVMAPMTRFFAAGGIPGPVNAAYYRRRVEGGLGLIITEGTFIDHPSASHNNKVPKFYDLDALAGWKLVVDAVHEAGGCILPQLWHVGAQRKAGEGFDPITPSLSPSGLIGPGQPNGQAMTQADIDAIVDAYASAAQSAQRLGFDGVEFHAAHGYLIDQFFWKGCNHRSDAYGGDIVARTRFGCEIIKETRRRVGPAFPICLRFSQWKLPDYKARLAESAAELEQFLAPLVDAGVDIFHCSVRRFWDAAFADSESTLSGWTRKLSGKPTITVGSVGLAQEFMPGALKASEPMNLDRVVELYEHGEFDLVAVGRIVIANPDWALKIRAGRIADLNNFKPSDIRTYVNDTVAHDLF